MLIEVGGSRESFPTCVPWMHWKYVGIWIPTNFRAAGWQAPLASCTHSLGCLDVKIIRKHWSPLHTIPSKKDTQTVTCMKFGQDAMKSNLFIKVFFAITNSICREKINFPLKFCFQDWKDRINFQLQGETSSSGRTQWGFGNDSLMWPAVRMVWILWWSNSCAASRLEPGKDV